MFFALLALVAASPVADPAVIQADAQTAESAYRRCMNSQGGADDAATGQGRATNMATSFCRPALETMLQAQLRLVDVSDLSDREKVRARRHLRDSLRALRDEALYPARMPRDYVGAETNPY